MDQGGHAAHLPPDVLSVVFALLAKEKELRPLPGVDKAARAHYRAGVDIEAELEEPRWLRKLGGTIGWIKFGQVCRAWRETLSEQHLLWANEIGALPKGVQSMLSNTGPVCPITLRVYGSSYRGNSALVWKTLQTALSLVCHRISAIFCIETRRDALSENGCVLFLNNNYFPRLESIDFVANEPEARTDGTYPVPHFQTPDLRVVKATNLTPFTTSAALTVLVLKCVEFGEGAEPWIVGLEQLLEMFGACCNTLLHLQLDLNVVEGVDLTTATLPIVTFADLRILRYNDPTPIRTNEPEHPIAIFNWLRYPAKTHVSMELRARRRTAAVGILRIITAILTAGSPHPTAIAIAKGGLVGQNNVTVLDFLLFRADADDIEPHDPYESNEWGILSLALEFCVAGTSTLPGDVIEAFAQAFNTPDIRALRLEGFCFDDMDVPFERFHAAQFLMLECPYVEPDTRYLCTRNEDGSLKLPNLRALCLHCTPPAQHTSFYTSEILRSLALRLGIVAFPPGLVQDLPEARITHLRVTNSLKTEREGVEHDLLVDNIRHLVGNLDWNPNVV